MTQRPKKPFYQEKWFIPLVVIVGSFFLILNIMDLKETYYSAVKEAEPTLTKQTETGELKVGGSFENKAYKITLKDFKENNSGSQIQLQVENTSYDVQKLKWKQLEVLDPSKTALSYKVKYDKAIANEEGLHLPVGEKSQISLLVDKASARYLKLKLEKQEPTIWNLSKK